MDSPDLQFKYQKLAFEYSKLRAQNQVLKKAIIEEQEKSTQFKENLKSREQDSRKAEQEIDSLSFRNQQLTKRLSLLQDDLEIINNKSSRKGRTKYDSHFPISIHDNNVYAEELESKIRENARLHAELTDLEIFYKSKVAELESHLEEASRAVISSSEDIKTNEQVLQSEIKKLRGERILQEDHAQQREARIISLEKRLQSYRQLEKRIDINSQAVSPSSLVNLPMNQPFSLEGKTQDHPNGNYIWKFSKPLGEFCCGFAEFFVSYSLLLKQSSTASSTQFKIIDQLVHEKNVWHLLYQRYDEMFSGVDKDSLVRLENLIGMNEFNKAFTNCASSLRRLLPVLSEKWICFQGQLDSTWNSTLSRVISCFASINPYISSLAAYSDGLVSLTPLAVRKILFFLHERISKLHFTSQELLTAWELLNIEDEKQAEAVKKSLSSIERALCKISSVFGENIILSVSEENGSSGSPTSPKSRSPGTLHLISHQDLHYFGSPDCVLASGNVNESETCIMQQLAQATSRLAKLEEEKEQWRLECQLLSHRLDKESKIYEQIKEEVHNLQICEDKVSIEKRNSSGEIPNVPRTSASIISEVIVGPCSVHEREKEIRSHFTNRCSQLYMQITSCISQAALYQNECESLLKRMAVLEDTKCKAEREVEKQRREKAQIQETLSTTSRNYEEQISTMSDHLADMNEKITLQADAVEQLKYELKKKTKK